MNDAVVVTLSPASVDLLKKIAQSLGTSSVEDTPGHVIGTQAAIAEQLRMGNQVTIKSHPSKLIVSKPL